MHASPQRLTGADKNLVTLQLKWRVVHEVTLYTPSKSEPHLKQGAVQISLLSIVTVDRRLRIFVVWGSQTPARPI
jgi:hypothetical protein